MKRKPKRSTPSTAARKGLIVCADLFLFMATKNCGHKLYITTAKKERLGLIVNHFLSTNHPPITTNQREKQV